MLMNPSKCHGPNEAELLPPMWCDDVGHAGNNSTRPKKEKEPKKMGEGSEWRDCLHDGEAGGAGVHLPLKPEGVPG